MPVKQIAYTCEFKCGYKSQLKRSRVVKHEKTCLRNPVNKTCASCIHNYKESDSFDTMQGTVDLGSWYACKVDKKPDNNSTFVRNCEFYKQSLD